MTEVVKTEDTIVEIGPGPLRGNVANGVHSFKGIAYGEAVSGRRRWQRAMPVTPWTDIKDATEYGPRAIQPECHDMKVTSSEMEELMEEVGASDDRWRAQSEECLTLSVWTPDPSRQRRLPVMFWCHGGKYFGETPPVSWFDGENLARSGDVVVVTVRHRVGTLGFLHLADLPGGAEYEDAANIGMLDMVDALKWVKDNIENFGGDPDNVTIFGESGGGMKVSVLLRMPEAEGLFHKAIVQSGSQLKAGTRTEGTERTLALMAELGLEPNDIEGLLDVPSEHLVEAQIRLTPQLFTQRAGAHFVEFEPIVDGKTLPVGCFDQLGSPLSKEVPLLVGTCATETTWFLSSVPGMFELDRAQMHKMVGGMLGADSERVVGIYETGRPDATPTEIALAITGDLIFRSKAIRMAELNADHGGAPVYMYILGFETNACGGKYRTPHTLDVPLVFAHPDHPILGSDPARFIVSKQMSDAWTAFARTGHPYSDSLPYWPAYDTTTRATMHFDREPQVVLDPMSAERMVW
ncbi:carboxylesterase/lipase family protein [Amycolatopsis sp. H20-H5]|uniref:carboxylesterase/lipase family protein n=1 Tax=Amycolatopsis sp. H20-H5 TaxID=3046309 RepID=UPI002DBC35E0|nr:carboxylesterase family protein [Amycolatopsis sp. H20-H5]MEC3974452.1 carboxylesterase family protein [Amycolatopsis sp. H20-H5]